MRYVGYAEAVLHYLKDKTVEVYVGTFDKTRKYYDFDQQVKQVLRGILKDANGELLILEIKDPLGNNNLVYLNGSNIISIVEPYNGMATMDIYVDEKQKV